MIYERIGVVVVVVVVVEVIVVEVVVVVVLVVYDLVLLKLILTLTHTITTLQHYPQSSTNHHSTPPRLPLQHHVLQDHQDCLVVVLLQ